MQVIQLTHAQGVGPFDCYTDRDPSHYCCNEICVDANLDIFCRPWVWRCSHVAHEFGKYLNCVLSMYDFD